MNFLALLTIILVTLPTPFQLPLSSDSAQASAYAATIAIVAVADQDGNPIMDREGISEILVRQPPRAEPGEAPLPQETLPLAFIGDPIYFPARTEIAITSSDLYIKLRTHDGAEHVIRGKATFMLDPDDTTAHILLQRGTSHTRSTESTSIKTGSVVLGSSSTRYVVIVHSNVASSTVECQVLDGTVTVTSPDLPELPPVYLDAPIVWSAGSPPSSFKYSSVLNNDELLAMRAFFATDRAESIAAAYPMNTLQSIMTSYSERELNASSPASISSQLRNLARIPEIQWSLMHGLRQEAHYQFREASESFEPQYNRIANFMNSKQLSSSISYTSVKWEDIHSPKDWLDVTLQTIHQISDRLDPVDLSFPNLQTNAASTLLELSAWYEALNKQSLATIYRQSAGDLDPSLSGLGYNIEAGQPAFTVDMPGNVIVPPHEMNRTTRFPNNQKHM